MPTSQELGFTPIKKTFKSEELGFTPTSSSERPFWKDLASGVLGVGSGLIGAAKSFEQQMQERGLDKSIVATGLEKIVNKQIEKKIPTYKEDVKQYIEKNPTSPMALDEATKGQTPILDFIKSKQEQVADRRTLKEMVDQEGIPKAATRIIAQALPQAVMNVALAATGGKIPVIMAGYALEYQDIKDSLLQSNPEIDKTKLEVASNLYAIGATALENLIGIKGSDYERLFTGIGPKAFVKNVLIKIIQSGKEFTITAFQEALEEGLQQALQNTIKTVAEGEELNVNTILGKEEGQSILESGVAESTIRGGFSSIGAKVLTGTKYEVDPQAKIQREEKKIIENNDKSIKTVAQLITGNKTVGGKKTDTGFKTPINQTIGQVGEVMGDMTDADIAKIKTSKTPTEDLRNFVDVKLNDIINPQYDSYLREWGNKGVVINGLAIQQAVRETKVYKGILALVQDGVQNGKIRILSNTIATSDPQFEDIVKAFNEINNRIAAIGEQQSPIFSQSIVDETNDNFINWYENKNNLTKAKASDQKRIEKIIGDITRETLRDTMDIATQGQFTPLAQKRAAYTGLLKKLEKTTSRAEGETLKEEIKPSIFRRTLKGGAGAIGLDDIFFPNIARTGLKVAAKTLKETLPKNTIDKKIIEAFMKYTSRPKAIPTPKQMFPQIAPRSQQTPTKQPTIVTPYTQIDPQAQKIGNQFDKVLEFINQFEADLAKQTGTKALPEGKPKRLMKGTEKSGDTIYLGQDSEAFQNRKAVELANIKEKYYDLREKYDALQSAIETNPLYPYIKNQATSGEFAGKLSDNTMERIGGKIENETGMDARDVQTKFEGLKGLIERRGRMEEELKDIYTDLKAIKNDDFTTIGNKYVSNQDKEDLSLLEGYKGDAEKGSPIEETPKEEKGSKGVEISKPTLNTKAIPELTEKQWEELDKIGLGINEVQGKTVKQVEKILEEASKIEPKEVVQTVNTKTNEVEFYTIPRGKLEDVKSLIDNTSSEGIAGEPIDNKIWHITAKSPKDMQDRGFKNMGMIDIEKIPSSKKTLINLAVNAKVIPDILKTGGNVIPSIAGTRIDYSYPIEQNLHFGDSTIVFDVDIMKLLEKASKDEKLTTVEENKLKKLYNTDDIDEIKLKNIKFEHYVGDSWTGKSTIIEQKDVDKDYIINKYENKIDRKIITDIIKESEREQGDVEVMNKINDIFLKRVREDVIYLLDYTKELIDQGESNEISNIKTRLRAYLASGDVSAISDETIRLQKLLDSLGINYAKKFREDGVRPFAMIYKDSEDIKVAEDIYKDIKNNITKGDNINIPASIDKYLNVLANNEPTAYDFFEGDMVDILQDNGVDVEEFNGESEIYTFMEKMREKKNNGELTQRGYDEMYNLYKRFINSMSTKGTIADSTLLRVFFNEEVKSYNEFNKKINRVDTTEEGFNERMKQYNEFIISGINDFMNKNKLYELSKVNSLESIERTKKHQRELILESIGRIAEQSKGNMDVFKDLLNFEISNDWNWDEDVLDSFSENISRTIESGKKIMGAKYIETKYIGFLPRGAIKYIIAPRGMSNDIYNKIKENGIDIIYYDGTQKDRINKIMKIPKSSLLSYAILIGAGALGGAAEEEKKKSKKITK